MSEHRFDNRESLDQTLATHIAKALRAAIDERGSASLVVSGGSTPAGLFDQLSRAELAWHNVTVLVADERWVAEDHPDRNEAMVRQRLLQHHAARARLLSLLPAFPNVADNLEQLNQSLADVPTFDVVILGMGADRHTASLFPCSAEVATGLQTDAPCLMVHPTTAPHTRLSLSRSRLANTREGIVHITGDSKYAVLEQARVIENTLEAPIAAFLPPNDRFSVWWAP